VPCWAKLLRRSSRTSLDTTLSCQYDRNRRASARVKDMMGRLSTKTLGAVSFGCRHFFLWRMDFDVRDAQPAQASPALRPARSLSRPPTSPSRGRNPACVAGVIARDECVKDGEGRGVLRYAPRLWAFAQF
jgi:hypothetical protein